MARTIAQILISITAALTANLSPLGITLSPSQVAEWNLWANTVAACDNAFEVIMYAFQADVQRYIDTKQLGSLSWYAAKMLQYQQGYNLQVNSDGTLSYAVIDTTAQIVQLASVNEVADESGNITLVIKVASIIGGVVTPLTTSQLLGVADYLKSIKIVGTKTLLVSQPADVVLYDVEVVYNPEFAQTNVAAAIATAITAFQSKFGFNPTFYASAFLQAILAVPGVVAAEITTLTGTPHGGSPASITLGYVCQAGYFSYDPASNINYTAA